MSEMKLKSLCILGCGNLGGSVLQALIDAKDGPAAFETYYACVKSTQSKDRLANRFSGAIESKTLVLVQGDKANIDAVQRSDVVIFGVDPSDAATVFESEELREALRSKLLISVMAGWSREKIERALKLDPDAKDRTWVIRVLPNIAASVSQSLTAIENPHANTPSIFLDVTDQIFSHIGRTVKLAPRHMNAATAVGGSTPAFFAVICDAMIDAAVAVGVPRASAQVMIYQAMQGTAAMLQSGVHPGILKDQGTSPEGCTIGGLMVLDEAGVRGHVGRAVREAVTLARLMEGAGDDLHVNDTRR